MVKSVIKAFIRTRPVGLPSDGLKVQADGYSLTATVPKDAGQGLINNQQEAYSFKFDGVLENVTQEVLYNTAVAEVVESVLSGFSGCVLAYGQTGAGKTFTMSGDFRNYSHRGVTPRAIYSIFKEIDMRVDKLYAVEVSYLEIYNDVLYDLLSPEPGASEGLTVMEDASQGTHVRGLTRVSVSNEEEALAQYFVGEHGRSTARHVLNATSSRSHCVFTVHLTIRTSEAASERAVSAKLHLVDLAGSERTKKTNATGQTLKEAQFINKSLSFLEQCVNALARKEAHVPFRQSRLTSVLRDALGGNCKTVLIANIWGEAQHLDETLSTLRFAARIRTLTTELGVAESTDAGMMLRRYERQIRELKQELGMRDALSGRSRINYEDLGDADIKDLFNLARQFIQSEVEVEQLPADTLKRIRAMYGQLKAVATAAQEDAALQIMNIKSEVALAAANGATGITRQDTAGKEAVGDVDKDARGFQVGVAPADLRPVAGIMQLPGAAGLPTGAVSTRQLHIPGTDSGVPSSPGGEDLGTTVMVAGGAERNVAFVRYKHDTSDGRNLNNVVKERAAQLKGIKISIKETAAEVNAAKAAIDRCDQQLALKPAELSPGNGAPAVVDVEYHTLLQELKSGKGTYRLKFDILKDLRSSLEPIASNVGEAKRELVEEFDKWLEAQGGVLPDVDLEELELDAGEAFERMQMGRITATDPDSVAYHSAMRKTAKAQPPRFGGGKAAADAQRKQEHRAAINGSMPSMPPYLFK